MKTPRELLLGRHHAMEPKLDAIREHVVGQLRPIARTPAPESLWDRLVMPLRWHAAGLTAIWIVIALLNTERPATKETAAKVSSPEQLFIAMQENRRQVLELTESADRLRPALQPYAPRRRSEAVPSFAVA